MTDSRDPGAPDGARPEPADDTPAGPAGTGGTGADATGGDGTATGAPTARWAAIAAERPAAAAPPERGRRAPGTPRTDANGTFYPCMCPTVSGEPCGREMKYVSGAPPVYCYGPDETDPTIRHTRQIANRVGPGGTKLPGRGRDGIDVHAASERPVSYARETLTQRLQQLTDTLDGIGELRELAEILTSAEDKQAEIAAAQRAAAAEVAHAQAERDEARSRERAAEQRARTADANAASAIGAAQASDEAAQDADDAREQADEARQHAERGRSEAEDRIRGIVAELQALQTRHTEVTGDRDRLAAELAAARTELQSTVTARDKALADQQQLDTRLTELATAHQQVVTDRDEQRHQLTAVRGERDAARREHDRAQREAAQLTGERDTAVTERDAARREATEAATARALAEQSVATLREQLVRDVGREREYTRDRLADADARHGELVGALRTEIGDLRTELADLRRSPTAPPPETSIDATDTAGTDSGAGTQTPDPAPAGTTSSRRRGAARPAAQRRPGPDRLPPAASTDTPGPAGSPSANQE